MSFRSNILAMRTGMSAEPAQITTQPTTGNAGDHFKKAHAAHKAGDHKAAKAHAFKGIKALPRSTDESVHAPVASAVS